MKTLEEYRKTIDKTDEKILKLLEQRIETVNKIKRIKINLNLPLKDKVREEEILKNLCAAHSIKPSKIKSLVRFILKFCQD